MAGDALSLIRQVQQAGRELTIEAKAVPVIPTPNGQKVSLDDLNPPVGSAAWRARIPPPDPDPGPKPAETPSLTAETTANAVASSMLTTQRAAIYNSRKDNEFTLIIEQAPDWEPAEGGSWKMDGAVLQTVHRVLKVLGLKVVDRTGGDWFAYRTEHGE